MTPVFKIMERAKIIGSNLKKVLTDPERKNLLQISWEFTKCCAVNRCFARHYLTNFLYRKEVQNCLDYISIQEGKWIQERINDPGLADLLSNKLNFVEHFERGRFPVPSLLGYNTLEKAHIKFNDGWKTIELASPQTLSAVLRSIVDDRGVRQVFLKPIRGTQGVGAFKVSYEELLSPGVVENLFPIICRSNYIIQEVVSQHPDMSKLNPKSLNSMRIDTFREPGCQAEILSAFLRIGGKNSHVDNVSAGGFFVGIDMETGTLKEKAMNRFHGADDFGTFTINPVTGIPFQGFSIPLFDKVKETVIQAAEWIPPSMLGWDVAVSADGPVLIEANILYYGLQGSDFCFGGYRRNPVYLKALKYAEKRNSRPYS